MAQEILQKILDGKVIAIVRGIGSKDIVKLAEAMEKGGINCIEVTFDQTSSETIAETKKSICSHQGASGRPGSMWAPAR